MTPIEIDKQADLKTKQKLLLLLQKYKQCHALK